MTAAVYLRVSTDKQTTENQEPAVRQLVEARGGPGAWEAATVYRETMSAAKDRPEFDRMMEDARLGRFRTLYVWSLDRFGRSMFVNLRDLTALADRFGVTVVSVREGWVEQTADPMLKKLLLAIFGWVAEHERDRLRARTRAGVDRARAAGKALGRPKGGGHGKVPVPARAVEKAAEIHAQGGRSWARVAAEVERLGLGRWNRSTLARECSKRVANYNSGGPRSAWALGRR